MGSPLEPFPAAPTSPGIPSEDSAGIELNIVQADDNTANIDTDNTANDQDPTPLVDSRLFSDASNTVGRERRESITASSNSRDSISRRLSKSFQESDLPRGFLAATADMTSTVVTAARSRSGTRTRLSTVSDPEERARLQQQQLHRTLPKNGDTTMLVTLDEHLRAASMEMSRMRSEDKAKDDKDKKPGQESGKDGAAAETAVCLAESVEIPPTNAPHASGIASSANNLDAFDGGAEAPPYSEYVNGYHFPPRYSKGESFRHGAVAFWHYFMTPVGFLVVLYGLNVVAWGGMLFLLLCNASPAMCYPTCNDINSPRRIWIEIDSQILNGLFCVTGFGLAPWRFRDMYFYLQWRIGKQEKGLRRLAGVHRGWLRLPGSQDLPVTTGPGNVPADTPCSAIPFPESKIPDMPLTGERAPPTRHWVIVFVLCMNLGNTFLQCVLSGFMWGMNRYNRPSWSTGLFVALGCLAGAFGGLGMFFEGKRVKGIEGVPLTDEDRAKLAHDRAMGIYHYNNLKGKKPKEQVTDVEANGKK